MYTIVIYTYSGAVGNTIGHSSDLYSTWMPEPIEHSSSYAAQGMKGTGLRVYGTESPKP